MIVDRPFVFTIDDKESGEILFIGAIINPLQ
jgi:serine protease inhibitor